MTYVYGKPLALCRGTVWMFFPSSSDSPGADVCRGSLLASGGQCPGEMCGSTHILHKLNSCVNKVRGLTLFHPYFTPSLVGRFTIAYCDLLRRFFLFIFLFLLLWNIYLCASAAHVLGRASLWVWQWHSHNLMAFRWDPLLFCECRITDVGMCFSEAWTRSGI